MEFLISIVVLSICSFIAVAVASRKSHLLAFIAAIAILFSSMSAYSNYKAALGQPVEMTWSEMPSKFTVVFFRIEGKNRIILWLIGDQLVALPYLEDAEEGLEGERLTMGGGTPSTFETKGEGGEGDGDGGEGDGEGDGGDGAGSGVEGWGYELQSRGGQVIPGTLPPKR
ncbi:MAG: hypothetical protein HOM01_15355 [Kordiimonadaceae bacterium]|jgi:hypothetical protein|nr:hypothetical protein [Kordiimonadaceae bacterium]